MTKRTLAEALAAAEVFESRHEMFKAWPGLYKWFRVNGHMDALAEIFPPGRNRGFWDEVKILDCIEYAVEHGWTRDDFKRNFTSAYKAMSDKGRLRLLHSRIKSTRVPAWTRKKVIARMKKCKTWREFRAKYPGPRHWVAKNGWSDEYRLLFLKIRRPKPMGAHKRKAYWVDALDVADFLPGKDK